MARTGHRSSQMVNRYRRIATGFAELAPLEQAIPELAQLALQGKVGLGLGQPDSNEGAQSMYSETKNAASPTGFESGGAGRKQPVLVAIRAAREDTERADSDLDRADATGADHWSLNPRSISME
jgi:hypothetical protein